MKEVWTCSMDGRSATGVQALKFRWTAGSCPLEHYDGVGRSWMLCCVFIHRSQIQTSAASILLYCFGQVAHSTFTSCKLDYKPWQHFLASAGLRIRIVRTTMGCSEALTMDLRRCQSL